ncbi:hypothetical protein T4C_2337 [Trichinella pseudospiralis]|uniref:Uncharacterized protein n=1 Tax=Trichinella pseudospiralis TaxID=6337 RepID=A0A0V1K529_TRIPS|nr:hypothetical protein T4C_2337 [Trichinella pseudospiralis]
MVKQIALLEHCRDGLIAFFIVPMWSKEKKSFLILVEKGEEKTLGGWLLLLRAKYCIDLVNCDMRNLPWLFARI